MKNYVDPKIKISMFNRCSVLTDSNQGLLDPNKEYKAKVTVNFTQAKVVADNN